MIGALFTAITGLQADEAYFNVIANNIANASTSGFKASETNFETMFSQTLRTPIAPNSTTGGTDPYQVGLGVEVAANVPIFTQGTSQTTGKPTDLMIQGNGFFSMSGAGGTYYTRNGAFDRDFAGNLVSPSTGMYVLGFQAQGSPPTVNTSAPIGPINIPNAYASFNIAQDGTVTGVTSTGQTVTLGQVALVTFPNPSGLSQIGQSLYIPTLNSGTPNTTAAAPAFTASTPLVANTSQMAYFPSLYVSSTAATPATASPVTVGGTYTTPPAAGFPALPITSLAVTFNASTTAGNVTVTAPVVTINGTAVTGTVTLVGSGTATATIAFNGLTLTIPGAAGLGTAGALGTATAYSVNLGQSGGVASTPGNGGVGTILPGALEMSNVDLSREFSNMIVAERGFQADSKVITTADSILMTLVNMKNQG